MLQARTLEDRTMEPLMRSLQHISVIQLKEEILHQLVIDKPECK